MKRKNKGRKIYKTKEKNYYGKSPVAKVLSGTLTALLIGGIGFLGYSLAEPIINYTQHKGDKPEEIPVTTAETASTTTSTETASVDSTAEVTTVTTASESVSADNYCAAALEPGDMASLEDIENALKNIPKNEEIEYIAVPLKISGGKICYKSGLYESKTSQAAISEVPPDKIAEAIVNNGFKPSAMISAFNDNIIPESLPETGYANVLDGSQWLDAAADDGGKPWASPYSEAYVNYLSAFVKEVAEAGFEHIVCSDLSYPDFTEKDLAILDQRLGQNERCMALTSAANLLYDEAISNGAAMCIEVSAADLLGGNDDILQPMLLSVHTVVLNIDVDELGAGVQDEHMLYEFTGTPTEKAEKCMELVSDKLSEFNVVIRISGESSDIGELLKAKDSIADYGFDSFIVK